MNSIDMMVSQVASDDARVRLRQWELPEALEVLDATSATALPDGLRTELEAIEDGGGVRHLHEVAGEAQVRAGTRGACNAAGSGSWDLAKQCGCASVLACKAPSAWLISGWAMSWLKSTRSHTLSFNTSI